MTRLQAPTTPDSGGVFGALPSRRSFLAAGPALALSRGASAARSQPNILYIMTDQQNAAMMSCTGNRWLKTPALDRLAGSGVRFELAYSANPVCMPARTSMISGRYPSYFGFDGNTQAGRPADAADLQRAMGNVVRAGGYRTVFGGKTHWPRPMSPKDTGFEYLTRNSRDGLADECVKFLSTKQDRPFLLVASFINPHDICYMAIDSFTKANNLPLRYPESVVERQTLALASRLPAGVSRQEFYSRLCPPLPPNHAPTAGEPSALAHTDDFRDWVRRNWSDEQWRLHRWAYCRLTERVDAEIGRVLAALESSGLRRNTVVIFSSDHGDMDSAHGFEHKSLPYEEAARVPLLISWPERIRAGRVDRTHLVSSSIDLLPTMCDIAGVEAPAGLPGRSYLPLALGKPPGDWRREVYIEFTGGRAIRGARYKYAKWNSGAQSELLIDMERDPGEMKNLADDPGSAGVLADQRERLRQAAERLAGGATRSSSGAGIPSTAGASGIARSDAR